jgi:hypothetical protein
VLFGLNVRDRATGPSVVEPSFKYQLLRMMDLTDTDLDRPVEGLPVSWRWGVTWPLVEPCPPLVSPPSIGDAVHPYVYSATDGLYHRYLWDAIDRVANDAAITGVKLEYTFHHIPRWASSQPNIPGSVPEPPAGTIYCNGGAGQCALPSHSIRWSPERFFPSPVPSPLPAYIPDLEHCPLPPTGTTLDSWRAYDSFLETLVAKVGSKIEAYELWNEPEFTQNLVGSSEETLGDLRERVRNLLTLTQHEYTVLSAAYQANRLPRPLFVSPVVDPVSVTRAGPNQSYFGELMDHYWLDADAAAPAYDAIATHAYIAIWRPESVLNQLTSVRDVASKYPRVAHLPIWSTEGNMTHDTGDADQQKAFIAKLFLLHWSAGAARFYLYGWGYGGFATPWVPTGASLAQPGPVPICTATPGCQTVVGTAYQAVKAWMTGATLTRPCAPQAPGSSIWSCTLERADRSTNQVVWASCATSAQGTADCPAPISYAVPMVKNVPRYTRVKTLEGLEHRIVGAVELGVKPLLLEP